MSKSRIEQAFEKWSRCGLDESDEPYMTLDQFKSALAELMPSNDQIHAEAWKVRREGQNIDPASFQLGMRFLRSALLQDNQTEGK
jgi:hypothetical protein